MKTADGAPQTYERHHRHYVSPGIRWVFRRTTKYALLVGQDVYLLSDQQTAANFAAQKVSVTGTLVRATNTLKSNKIAPAMRIRRRLDNRGQRLSPVVQERGASGQVSLRIQTLTCDSVWAAKCI